MADIQALSAIVHEKFSNLFHTATIKFGELTLEVSPQHLHELCIALRDDEDCDFKMLIDVCGVDYLHYGISEWETESATSSGFERGVVTTGIETEEAREYSSAKRFASVYHLLSLNKNHRIRLKVFLDTKYPHVLSVVSIWPSANWFERESFDLFGIVYTDHPDLRRLLTDYGFIGHPFRKDFPLIGNVEIRYDAKLKSVVYEPVSIVPRILEPKVIRHDNRYEVGK
jgi:NADH-quinone oxidoreductase subunit C